MEARDEELSRQWVRGRHELQQIEEVATITPPCCSLTMLPSLAGLSRLMVREIRAIPSGFVVVPVVTILVRVAQARVMENCCLTVAGSRRSQLFREEARWRPGYPGGPCLSRYRVPVLSPCRCCACSRPCARGDPVMVSSLRRAHARALLLRLTRPDEGLNHSVSLPS